MLNIIAFTTATVTIFEALALNYGTQKTENGRLWRNRQNLAFIWTDVAFGVFLLLTFSFENNFELSLFLATVLAATHLARTINFFMKKENPFCANVPLLFVNVLKLLGFVLVLVLLTE